MQTEIQINSLENAQLTVGACAFTAGLLCACMRAKCGVGEPSDEREREIRRSEGFIRRLCACACVCVRACACVRMQPRALVCARERSLVRACVHMQSRAPVCARESGAPLVSGSCSSYGQTPRRAPYPATPSRLGTQSATGPAHARARACPARHRPGPSPV
jgi:hypothetical protein